MNERLVRSVAWVVGSRSVIQVLSLVSTLLVARLLSPSDYGVMAVATAVTGALILLTELGVGTMIVQFPDPRTEELNGCFWLTVGAATATYALVYLGAPRISLWFGIPQLDAVLRVVGLGLPIAALRLVPESLLRKGLNVDRIAKGDTLAMILSIPFVLSLAAAGAGVWTLVGGAVLMTFVQTASACWFARWRPGIRVGSGRPNALVRFGGATLGNRVFASTYQQVDAFLLGKIAGETTLGFFSMAKQLALLPVEKVSAVVNQIMFPVFAELQGDRSATRRAFLTGFQLVVCITLPLCTGMALVAEDLVAVLLTDKWLPAVPLLQLLCLYALIRSLDVLLPPVLFARYRAPFLLWYAMGLLLVMTPAFWAGAAWRGAMGVALAWVVVYPPVMILMAREAFRELEISWGTLWQHLRPAVEAALAMACVVLAVHWFTPGTDSSGRVLRLVLGSGLGALAYILGILWRARPLTSELTQAVKLVLRSHASPRLRPRGVDGAQLVRHESRTP